MSKLRFPKTLAAVEKAEGKVQWEVADALLQEIKPSHATGRRGAGERRLTDPEAWWGPLPMLYDALADEAMRSPNEWRSRSLSRGALVSLCWQRAEGEPIGRFVMRIARPEKPRDESGIAKWEVELATFREQFKMSDSAWERQDEPGAKGVAVRYLERMPLEEAGVFAGDG